jgi:hypothetical protein
MIWFYGGPDDGGPCTHTAHLLSSLHFFLAFLPHHHHHHPCLAASSISFLGGIGIALFLSLSHLFLSTVTLLLVILASLSVLILNIIPRPHFISDMLPCVHKLTPRTCGLGSTTRPNPSSTLNANPTLEVSFSLTIHCLAQQRSAATACLLQMQQ